MNLTKDQFRNVAKRPWVNLAELYDMIEAALRTATSSKLQVDWSGILEAVIRESVMDQRQGMFPEVWTEPENAPGHAHTEVGIWDDDNGDPAGHPCAWCLAWNGARKALAAINGGVQ